MNEVFPELDRHLSFLLNRHNGADLIKRHVFPHLGFVCGLIERYRMDRYRKAHKTISYFNSCVLSPMLKQTSSRSLSEKMENHVMLHSVCEFKEIPTHGSFSEEYPKFKEPFLSAVVDELVDLLRRHGAINKNDTAIYDVTFVICNTELSKWGWCGSTKGKEYGIRVHLVYGMKSDIPLKVIVTEGNVHELQKFDDLHVRAKELGFRRNGKDRGYTDYQREKKLALDGDFFVTTMKSNCKHTVLSSKKVEHDFVVNDKIIWIDKMEMAIRALETKKSSGKGTYHILTNDTFGKLDEVFEECKGRWAIETHNKFDKHVLGMNIIKSKSTDGVIASIYFCIIAFLLLKLFAVLVNMGNANAWSIVRYIEYPADEIRKTFIDIRRMFLKSNEVMLSAPKGTQINTPTIECL